MPQFGWLKSTGVLKPEPVEDLLNRYMFLSLESQTFISGSAEFHKAFEIPSNCSSLEEICRKRSNTVPQLLQSIAGLADVIPNRDTLYFVLAVAAKNDSLKPSEKAAIYNTVLSVIRNDADLFKFIKFFSKLEKCFSSGINSLIINHYTKKEPIELARDVNFRLGYHGWTHKDIIKLTHMKGANKATEVILSYVLFGSEKATQDAGDDKDALEIVNFMKKCQDFRTCNSEQRLIEYLKDLENFGYEQIPPKFNKSPAVWKCLLDKRVPCSELLKSLYRLYKHGLFTGENSILDMTVDLLTNEEYVKESKVQPAEVFIALRNFEKGGKPKDPKLIRHLEEKLKCDMKAATDPEYKKPNFAHTEPAKCPPIVQALNRALVLSYPNVQPTGKRYLITLNAKVEMNKPCITTKNVTCLEASAIMALSLLKAEKKVTIAVFNGKKITPIVLDKTCSIANVIKRVRESENGEESYSSPYNWALERDEEYDVFINMYNANNFVLLKEESQNPYEAMKRYNYSLNIVSKLVLCHLGQVRRDDFNFDNVLDIRGFDKNVPKLIDAFSRNYF